MSPSVAAAGVCFKQCGATTQAAGLEVVPVWSVWRPGCDPWGMCAERFQVPSAVVASLGLFSQQNVGSGG